MASQLLYVFLLLFWKQCFDVCRISLLSPGRSRKTNGYHQLVRWSAWMTNGFPHAGGATLIRNPTYFANKYLRSNEQDSRTQECRRNALQQGHLKVFQYTVRMNIDALLIFSHLLAETCHTQNHFLRRSIANMIQFFVFSTQRFLSGSASRVAATARYSAEHCNVFYKALVKWRANRKISIFLLDSDFSWENPK